MTMRKHITRLFFILSLLGVVLPGVVLRGVAQGKPDKWANARDYLNCKLSLAVIQQKAKAQPELKVKLDKIRGPLIAATVESPLSFDNLKTVLAGFDKVLLTLSTPVSRLDVKRMGALADHKGGVTMLVDSAFYILKKGYGDMYDSVEKGYRAELTEDLVKVLAPAQTVATTSGGAGVSPAESSGAGPGSSRASSGDSGGSGHKRAGETGSRPGVAGAVVGQGGFFSGFNFWILLLLVLVLGGGYYGYQKISELFEQNKRRMEEIKSYKNYPLAEGRGSGERGGGTARGGSERAGSGALANAGSGGGGSNKKELDRAIQNSDVIASLNDAIHKLQHQVMQLENKLSGKVRPEPGQFGGSSGGVSGGLRTIYQETTKPDAAGGRGSGASGAAASAEVFYMAGPVNNYFPISAKSSSKDNTVYKFQVSANRQEASFEIHTDGAPVMEIVRSAQSYIKPACDEQNLPGANVRNIVTVQSGEAILEGNKWVIKNKALIRYE